MEPPTAEAVLQGVFTLYNDPNNVEKEKASKWLEEFQKSIHSWKIADELLRQKHDLNSCTFAAQTMRNKIQNSFHELPESAHESLRQSLLEHLSHITIETKSVIVTQLSLALADLALLMSSWQKPVATLLQRFSSNANMMYALIELLTLIPEEVNSRHLRLGANRRKEILIDLEADSTLVSEYLTVCLVNGNENELLRSKILKCFTSWVQINAFKLPEISDSMIIVYCFQLLSSGTTSPDLHEAATDSLCSLLHCMELNNSRGGLDEKLFGGIMCLEEAYNMSVAQEDLDKSMNLCRLFTVLVESNLTRMVALSDDETPHYSVKSLDLVLNCVGHYDYEVAEITFNMWYRLSEDLYQRNNYQLTAHFKPYVERLIAALYKHSQLDPDHDGLVEEGGSFKDFRSKVSEIIKDVIFIVSSISCFKQMFVVLQSPNVSWESSEAALFIMQNVARNILPEESEVVPKVVEAILNLPENCHIAIRYTSISILGELCDWIDSNPETLQPVLNFLLFALQQKNGLASAAANSLQLICSTCKKHMVGHISGLMEIARCLDSFDIQSESAIGLLKGISIIIGRLPPAQLTPAMQELCSFQVEALSRLANGDDDGLDGKKSRSDPAFWLDRLASIYRHVSPTVRNNEVNPCAFVIVNNWNVLSRALERYKNDSKIMERIVRCIRYAIRCIGKQAMPILEPLVKQIITIYSGHNHSCLLYLGSILVDEFAYEEGCTQGLLNMLQAFIEPTFGVLQMENGLKNHPDMVDDFFRLATRFIQRAPLQFLQSPLVTPIIQCGLLACTLDHREANISVMRFFCSLLRHDRANDLEPMVQSILASHGEALIMNLLYASVFCLHSNMLSDVAEVFVEIKQHSPHQLEEHVKKAVDSLPKKNSGGSVTVTHEQMVQFVTNVVNSQTARATTQALQDFARLYR
ncbi:transportin-3 isoform X2 [Anopheles merus]|uniref:Transportin-3 n=4 Tax=gambiae species complex TaxID=44542 RepID=Q5TT59_ANOGA|nr:transportin-3 isoform X2 [Anopheles coluzzii]XP_041762130.1 transportin-3 isoform X2 [Anopheles merus]XP_562427.1 transportin-3 isoform X2 [Anopheles gambiae]EAL40594.1 AGAP003576-PA [Anopheles gambiae str. PEST]